MAHALDMTGTSKGMAYVESEGKPWHGLGTGIKKGASPEEVGKAAGLLWRVKQEKVRFPWNDGEKVDPNHVVMFRDDTGDVLDVTGKGYVPHQNIEVLEFFAEYLNAGAMYIDTAGALNGGRQIWVQAKMDGGFTLPGDDVVQGRILLMNPHQYGKGMIAKFVAERVVCWNTLTMALGEAGRSVKIWHTAEFNKARQDEVKRDLGIANERLDAFKQDAQKLTKLKLEVQDAINILAPVLDGKKDEPLEQQGKTMTRVVELWQGAGKGAALKSANGTAWGLLNGVTQYYDHEYGRTADSRLTMAWLGDGEVRKRKSMGALLQAAA